jgi:hypothetical protein
MHIRVHASTDEATAHAVSLGDHGVLREHCSATGQTGSQAGPARAGSRQAGCEKLSREHPPVHTTPAPVLQIYDGDSISLRSQRANKLCGLHPVDLATTEGGSNDEVPNTRRQHNAIVCGDFFTTKATAFTVRLPYWFQTGKPWKRSPWAARQSTSCTAQHYQFRICMHTIVSLLVPLLHLPVGDALS